MKTAHKKKKDYVQDFFFPCAQPVSLMWMWGSSLIKKLSSLFTNIFFFKSDIGSGFSVCWSFWNVAQAWWRSESHPSKQWESRSSPVKKKKR